MPPVSSVLITGGTGFIGRHLVQCLLDMNITSIKVADKSLPSLSWLNDTHQQALSKVEFVQANLSQDASVQKLFSTDFDLVVHLASETKYGLNDDIYKEKVLDVAVRVAKAAKGHCKFFIEVSTGQVYDHSNKALKEDAKCKPWTKLAEYKLKAEQALKEAISPLCILRPAIVYGPADTLGLTPRLIIAHVYQHLNETMEFLWGGDLAINTVHVRDLCRAIVYAAQNDLQGTFNVVDQSNTTQASMNELLQQLFKVECSFAGSVTSQFAKLNLGSVCQDVNEKHMAPWSDMLKKEELNSHLTPYLDKELLYNHGLCLDGSALVAKGFQYDHPKVTKELLSEVVEDYQKGKMWPSK